MRIAIVGGGISGLATAYFLARQSDAAEVTLFEASSRWGGSLLSEHLDGFCFEGGADAFLRRKRQAHDLCRDLGLEGQLLEASARHRRSYVWWDESLRPLPSSFLLPPIDPDEFRGSSLLSARGRERALSEPSIPPGDGSDESVASFVARRFGEEVLERIAAPMVAGIFGATASEVSVKSTFPSFLDVERERGCLLGRGDTSGSRAPVASESRPSPFLSLRYGMGSLAERLRSRLEGRVEFRVSCPVASIDRAENQLCLLADGGSFRADAVVLATPAPAAARLLAGGFPEAADSMSRLDYSPAVIVCMGFKERVPRGRDGSGFIVPPSAGAHTIACSWLHQKLPSRAQPGSSLLRCFIAGETARRSIDETDESLIGSVRQDLERLLGLTQAPVVSRVYRWRSALPIYRVGHSERIADLRSILEQVPGVFCVGNYWDGVGIPDCIRHARDVADRCVAGSRG